MQMQESVQMRGDMQAQVLEAIGEIRLKRVERPVPRKGMVLVKVMAAGICGSDIPRIYHTGAHRMPLVPGHEFSGLVTELGEGTDADWLGKRVGVFPLIPCGVCPQCRKKLYEMCSHYNYLGSRTDGGFAEYVAVPVWNLVELPERVTFQQAAMLEPSSVAVHAVRAVMKEVVSTDETVAVCGLGTIGLLVVSYLKGMGYRHVYLMGNKAAQREMAKKLGIAAEDFCDIRQEDPAAWIREKTAGQGVDVFFECVGRNETVSLAVASAAPGGRVMLVGNPATDMELPRDVYWKILRNQLTVKGTWNSSYTGEACDDWHRVLQAISDGWFCPEELITHRLSLKELQRGFEIMRDKTEDYVKIMMISQNA